MKYSKWTLVDENGKAHDVVACDLESAKADVREGYGAEVVCSVYHGDVK